MNITVGNYETKNFDVFKAAAVAFDEYESDDKHELIVVEHAAKAVDYALGVLKRSMVAGVMTTTDFDEFIECIDKAEELLDSVDELEQHYYLRDSLESMAVEMYDLSDVDADGHAEDFANEESWLFGPDDEEESETW